mmetsp:Transcript_61903/g.134130  ORF Transcript_61903/g.134130 Transcript_61903/m.134130 type:complete len:268 (-) Transcript_61903:7-810(-)
MGQASGVGPSLTKSSGVGTIPELGLEWASSCMQGWRDSMEDAHFAVRSLGSGGGWETTAAFGVMDGHGGSQVAKFCEHHLPYEISLGPSQDVCAALTSAFHQTDENLRRSWYVDAVAQGCTAVVCCVRSDAIFVANAGDSRAVLCRAGRPVALSEDHKPGLASERARISKAGGFVADIDHGHMTISRVNGDLSLSRAIGDLRYKQRPDLSPEDQVISATPDVRTFWRQPNDEFMVLACDGIWDVLSNADVVRFVRARLRSENQVSLP